MHFHRNVIALLAIFAAVCSAQAPSFEAAGVVNAASLDPTLAPGARANIFGANLGPQGTVTAGTPTGSPQLEGVEVLFGDAPGSLIVVSATQITVDIPPDLPPGPVDVVVRYNGVPSAPATVTLQAFAPAFYTTTGTDGVTIGAFGGTDTISTANPANPNEALTGVANGLGDASGAGPMQPTDAQPTVTVGCNEAELQASFFNTDFGSYQADFTVPGETPGGLIPVTIAVGGVTSPSVSLPVSGAPVPAVCAAVNAASFAPDQPVAAGSILTLFGLNLSAGTNLGAFPNVLVDGVAVTFNGTAGPLFALTPAQLNVLVPPDLPETGMVDVQVMTAEGSSDFQIELAAAAPGAFPVRDPRDPSRVYAAALRGNTAWLAIPSGMAQALSISTDCMAGGVDPAASCGEPIRRGDSLQIYVTGLGKATAGGDPNAATLPAGKSRPRTAA